MKNRICKKLGALGMAFFMTGMVFSGNMAGATAYAAGENEIYEESNSVNQEDTKTELSVEEAENENQEMDNTEAVIQDGESKDAEKENYQNVADEEALPDEQNEVQGTHNEDMANTEDNKENPAPDESVSDGTSEDTESVRNRTMLFTVTTDEASVKAGTDLVYTVTLENTGDVMLKNIQTTYVPTQEELIGEWSDEYGNMLNQEKNTVKTEGLDVGMKKLLYLTVKLPEGQENSVSAAFTATAETDEEESESVISETRLETVVIPLKASFEVTKTADRSVAVPGDKILFQICIRNTGERTLHSVITTERFQLGNVPVQFLEKEGVVLNKTKTKARIEKIEPGKAAGLQAMVVLPKDIKEQDLLNEVTVTTLETGDQTIASQAKIQVKAGKEESTDSVEGDSVDTGNDEISMSGESYPASTHPKTGDPYQPFLWLAMIPGSLLAAGWIRSRL